MSAQQSTVIVHMNSHSYCLLAFSKSNFWKCSSPSLLRRGVVIKAPLEKKSFHGGWRRDSSIKSTKQTLYCDMRWGTCNTTWLEKYFEKVFHFCKNV